MATQENIARIIPSIMTNLIGHIPDTVAFGAIENQSYLSWKGDVFLLRFMPSRPLEPSWFIVENHGTGRQPSKEDELALNDAWVKSLHQYIRSVEKSHNGEYLPDALKNVMLNMYRQGLMHTP